MTITISIDFSAFAAKLEEVTRDIQAAVARAISRGLRNAARDGLKEWRRVTPRRTGQLRASLVVVQTPPGRVRMMDDAP